jgi:diguanylate cyclase (GGDEF)-like protein
LEEQVRQLAFNDALTGVPNRRLLLDRLTKTMAASKRSAKYGAVIFLDLDNFKPLNDAHGHEVGDMLLIQVARRLTTAVRAVDTVARLGGDEFVVLLAELDAGRAESVEQARTVAEKIRASLAAPYLLNVAVLNGGADRVVEHHCSASMGVVVFFAHEVSQTDILRRADSAMYQAKEAGRNTIRFYGPHDGP